jgi:hypothetical protein
VTWDYGLLCTEVYDLDKPIGHSFGDVEYYAHLLAGVTGRILEPAAGTGRILIPLLEAGLNVEGIDTSAEMLAICRRNCAGRGLDPVLRQADMTSYVEAGAFAAIIIPAGSITLLDGGPATRQALAAFHQSLVRGGRLIVDIDAPRLVTGPQPARHWRNGADLLTLQVMLTEHDPVANQTTSFLRYEKWRDGCLIATELQQFRLQHWSLEEFTGLLAGAGFADIAVTADYTATVPGPDSESWTFQATRA